MLGARQPCGFVLGDALETDLDQTDAYRASLANRAGLASDAAHVSGGPGRALLRARVGVFARVPAGVASQRVLPVGLQPIHPGVVDADDVRGVYGGRPCECDAYLGNIQLLRSVNQNAQPRVLTGAPVRARDT